MKRYAIVRVDGECPKGFNEDIYCKWCGNCGRIYGDTKEQLIRKVAQVLFRRRLEMYNLIWGGVPSKQEAERYYEVREEIAKEIVEFLGVEE